MFRHPCPMVDLNRNHPSTSGSIDRTAFARFCSKPRSGAGEVGIDKSNLHQKCPGTCPPDGGSMSRETSVGPVVPVALVKCPVVNKGGTCTCSPPEAPLHHATSPRAVLFSSRRRRGPCCWSFTKGGKNRRTTLGSWELNAYGFRWVRATIPLAVGKINTTLKTTGGAAFQWISGAGGEY